MSAHRKPRRRAESESIESPYRINPTLPPGANCSRMNLGFSGPQESCCMNLRNTRVATILALNVCAMLTAMAHAAEPAKQTQFSTNGPVEVPGMMLDTGQYLFKLIEPEAQRNVLQVFETVQLWTGDGTRLLSTMLTMPNYDLPPTDKTVFTFFERGPQQPKALRIWFAPGRKLWAGTGVPQGASRGTRQNSGTQRALAAGGAAWRHRAACQDGSGAKRICGQSAGGVAGLRAKRRRPGERDPGGRHGSASCAANESGDHRNRAVRRERARSRPIAPVAAVSTAGLSAAVPPAAIPLSPMRPFRAAPERPSRR